MHALEDRRLPPNFGRLPELIFQLVRPNARCFPQRPWSPVWPQKIIQETTPKNKKAACLQESHEDASLR